VDEIKKVQLHADTFKKMHNLRIIKFHDSFRKNSNVTFDGFLMSFPNDLKILQWTRFPQRSLPQNFRQQNLIRLDMIYSDLEKLWEGDQVFHFKLYILIIYIYFDYITIIQKYYILNHIYKF
jgi:hypothetical protein